MTELNNQNVIVTGANRGIGRVIAETFVEKGATVGLLGRRKEAVTEAREEILESYSVGSDSVGTIVADVSDSEQVDSAISEWIDANEGVHTLVNNAGINRDGLLLRMSPDDWDTVQDVNLNGAFYCTKSVIRSMIKNRWGRIIMISSVAGVMGNPGQSNYSASKAGLIGFCKSIARELGSREITANTIAPGYIETDMTEELSEDRKDEIKNITPLERFGSAREVAESVEFLASEKASYITGEVIRVDGGMAM